MILPVSYDPRSEALVSGGFRETVRGMGSGEAVEYLLDLLDFLLLPEDQEIEPLREKYKLTLIEAKLVLALQRVNQRCVSKATLMGVIYGTTPEDEWPLPKIIDVFVCKVRRKLTKAQAPFQIETIWGQGYRLAPIKEVSNG